MLKGYKISFEPGYLVYRTLMKKCKNRSKEHVNGTNFTKRKALYACCVAVYCT